MAPTITLTGSFKDLLGNSVTSGTVTAVLMGYGADIPRVAGTAIFDLTSLSASVSGSGTFTLGPFYGNDVITPGPLTTYYQITMPSGSSAATVTKNYQFSGSGSFDLSQLVPMGTPLRGDNTIANAAIPQVFSPTSHQFLTGMNSLGAFSASHPSVGDLSEGSTGTGAVVRATSPTIATPVISGTVSSYNGFSTVNNGVPVLVAAYDATAQGADVASTLLYAVPSTGAGAYRVSAYLVVTRAATSSSTLPNCAVSWTDSDSSVAKSNVTFTTSSTLNSVGVTSAGAGNTTNSAESLTFYAKASTNINIQTDNFATSGATSMQFAIHVRLEYLG